MAKSHLHSRTFGRQIISDNFDFFSVGITGSFKHNNYKPVRYCKYDDTSYFNYQIGGAHFSACKQLNTLGRLLERCVYLRLGTCIVVTYCKSCLSKSTWEIFVSIMVHRSITQNFLNIYVIFSDQPQTQDEYTQILLLLKRVRGSFTPKLRQQNFTSIIYARRAQASKYSGAQG